MQYTSQVKTMPNPTRLDDEFNCQGRKEDEVEEEEANNILL